MNLNDKQNAILDRLREADKRYRSARVDEYARARREADERIAERRIARDVIAAEASLAGVPMRQVARVGLSTSNAQTAKAAIEHGLQFIDVEAPAADEATVGHSNFELLAADLLRVTLRDEEFTPWAPAQDEKSFTFTLTPEGGIEPDDFDADETWMHPVVIAMMAPDKTWMKKALAWLEEQA